MDAETVKDFKSIINRISNEAIDEMVEDGIELNSTTYQAMMEIKFDRYAEFVS